MAQPVRFIVVRHSRLAFRDAQAKVETFVRQRLEFYGAEEIAFTDDVDSARVLAKAMYQKSSSGHVVVQDIMNPMVDYDLVCAMVASLERTGAAICFCDGAIPGTQVNLVLSAAHAPDLPETSMPTEAPCVTTRWFTQEKFNNQFNLYKYKRLKIFLCLLGKVALMHRLSISEFVEVLETDAVFERLAAYGEPARLVRYDVCPHCSGRLTPLPMRMSQPFCGYLPASRPLYHECEQCGLVTASPAVHEDDLPRMYDEYDKQDFQASWNNPYDGSSPRCDFTSIERSLPVEARTLDLGGGMGRFSRFLKQSHPSWNVTHSDFAIKRNAELQAFGISTRELNFLREPIGRECYDLVTAWEVIEHIPYHRLEGALQNVHDSLRTGGYFVFSTPDFDSPLCRSYDFYAMCPPFHYLVFGEKWLRRYFQASGKWNHVESRPCSDFLDDAVMWSDYGARTCPSFQLRAFAEVFGSMFKAGNAAAQRRSLLQSGYSTEVIITLRKA